MKIHEIFCLEGEASFILEFDVTFAAVHLKSLKQFY